MAGTEFVARFAEDDGLSATSVSVSDTDSSYSYFSGDEEYVRQREPGCFLRGCSRKEADDSDDEGPVLRRRARGRALDRLPVKMAKRALLDALDACDGEPRDARVVQAAATLAAEARVLEDQQDALRQATGTWRALTRADFPGSVGQRDGAYAYTLGRMSFGLFAPGEVVITVDDSHVIVKHVSSRPHLPEALAKKISDKSEVRSYNIEVRFTVDDERAKGLRGTITTYGYCVESPHHADDAAHRLDVWFAAGDLCPDFSCCEGNADRAAADVWAGLFGRDADDSTKRRGIVGRATLWLLRVALGIELAPVKPEGVQCYTVARPITGHVDVMYSDDDLRVTRGNRNSLVVMRRSNNDRPRRVVTPPRPLYSRQQ